MSEAPDLAAHDVQRHDLLTVRVPRRDVGGAVGAAAVERVAAVLRGDERPVPGRRRRDVAEVVPRREAEQELVVGQRQLLALVQPVRIVRDVHAPEPRLRVAIIGDHVVPAVGARQERAMIAADRPEDVGRRGHGAVRVVELPADALAHPPEADARTAVVADEILGVRRDPDVRARIDVVAAVDRVPVRPGRHVVPVVQTHRGFRAVPDHHVPTARIEPVQRGPERPQRGPAGRREVERVRPRAARRERDPVNAVRGVVVKRVRIDRIEPAVPCGDRGPVRQPAVGDRARRHVDHVPEIRERGPVLRPMEIARSVGVPPHVPGVDVVVGVIGREPSDRLPEHGIDVARAHRQRGGEPVVGEPARRGRRVAPAAAQLRPGRGREREREGQDQKTHRERPGTSAR